MDPRDDPAADRDEAGVQRSDIVPEDATRGAPTIPNPQAQTGITTPPIAGWGEDVGDTGGTGGDEIVGDETPRG